MIGVIDYKAGNAPSVMNALHKLNIPSALVSCNKQIEESDAIILPGVGTAEATIASLKDMNCLDTLGKLVLNEGIPFLGICVGLQILFEHSEEGNVKCMGWLPGCVKRFSGTRVRVPQMGWNEVCFTREHKVLHSLKPAEFFYFVNSYYVVPENKDIILAETDYDINFCSMVAHKNIIAAQFHIEKSGASGLKLLRNFALNALNKEATHAD